MHAEIEFLEIFFCGRFELIGSDCKRKHGMPLFQSDGAVDSFRIQIEIQFQLAGNLPV
jgi:hypothetical protein